MCATILLMNLLTLIPLTSALTPLTRQEPANAIPSREIFAVAFCDLVTHPEQYENKTVRVTARYFLTWEGKILYHPQCSGIENRLWPQFECQKDNECSEMADWLNDNLVGDPFRGLTAELTVIGRIRRPIKPQKAIQKGLKILGEDQ